MEADHEFHPPALSEEASGPRKRDGLLTTGDMARLSGSTLRTVRFYEEAELLTPEQRTLGGHRLFSKNQLERLRIISRLRVAGLSLEAIRDLLRAKESSEEGSKAAELMLGVLDGQIEAMRERLSTMEQLLVELVDMRQTLAKCRQCAHPELFPDDCSKCEVMNRRSQNQSSSLNVFWGLTR